jgi:ribonuclease Z
MKFNVTILGSGAATPTLRRFPTSQLINCNEKYILIDCGEGSQIQMRRFKQKFQKISLILISHLHGDHYFGLAGLISSFVLLGRTSKLKIICPKGLKNIILSQIELGNAKIPFDIEFDEIELTSKVQLYEDSLLEVYGFPLNHRIQTHGFEIREKKRARNFIKYKLEELKITVKEIGAIKKGEDLVRDGKIVALESYTTDSPRPLSYTYCSDNRIQEKQIPFISNTDLLYHEATFVHAEVSRAKKTFHSTSKEVGQIAAKANIKNILLGHFSARYDSIDEHLDECQQFVPNVFCVEDGNTFEISENAVKILG